MDYLLDLTENEIKYICEAIPYQETSMYFRKYPREFAKLKPGFRVETLTKEMMVRILYEFRRKDFIASYLIKHINRWIKEIDEELEKAYKEGLSQEEAYITVLPDSYFEKNLPLFFKMKEEEKATEYLKVLGVAVSFEATRKKEERIIRQYGYNVSKEEGLSDARRRKMLSLLIDNDILTKNEIINYLEFFISQHKKPKKFKKAVEKWETDKKFISEYKLGDYTQIGVAGIYRKRNNKG